MTRIRRRPANLKLAGLRVAVVAVLRVNETIRRVWPRPAARGTEHGRRRAGTGLSERLPGYHDSTRQRSGGTVHWKVTRGGLGTHASPMLAANLRYQERLAWRKWAAFFGGSRDQRRRHCRRRGPDRWRP